MRELRTTCLTHRSRRNGGASSGSSATGKFFVLTLGGLVIDGRALMAMAAAFLVAVGMCMA